MSTSKHTVPGPDDITRVQLPNGITVLVRPNPNTLSVFIKGYLQVGGLFDPDEKLGLGDFTASALMRGTQTRTFQEIYNALESNGARLGFSSATHTTSFNANALGEDLGLLIQLLADTLRNPVFPAKHIARLRSHLLTSLAIRAQSTSEMASLTFDKLVYPNHPYSRPEDGYKETIQAITREDIIAFHQKHYGPRGMVIVIVGAIEPNQAIDWVTRELGDWENHNQPEPPALPNLPPLETLLREKVDIPGKIQADIVMGVAGPPRTSDDFIPAAVGNSILGQFGMMGRIGEAVREKAGLAYYAYSSVSGGIGPGPWTVNAGVNPANIDRAIDLIRQEIRRFVTEPVTNDELDDVQANFIGLMPLALESNAGVASALLNIERYNLGLDYYIRYESIIRRVTPEQILNVARHYLDPDRLAIAIAGP